MNLYGEKAILYNSPQMNFINPDSVEQILTQKNILHQNLLRTLAEEKIVRNNLTDIRKGVSTFDTEPEDISFRSKQAKESPNKSGKYVKGFLVSIDRFPENSPHKIKPGPGDYEIPLDFASNKAHKKGCCSLISKSKRFNSFISGSMSPGPGEYDPTKDDTYKERKDNLMMKRIYKTRSSVVLGKQYSKEERPGPGYYNPKDSQKITSGYISQIKKVPVFPENPNDNPAPGMYNFNTSSITINNRISPFFKSSIKPSIVDTEAKELISLVKSPTDMKSKLIENLIYVRKRPSHSRKNKKSILYNTGAQIANNYLLNSSPSHVKTQVLEFN